MNKKTLVTLAIIIACLVALAVAAHKLNLVGLLRQLHGMQ